MEISWDRKRYSGSSSIGLPSNFAIDLGYDYETKKGRKLSGAVMGITGGNPRSVVVPQRIDYATQQVHADLQYAGENFQASLGYYGSFFDDKDDSFTWENPYLAQAAWNPTAGYMGSGLAQCVGVYGCGRGRKHAPPDNLFNQILASAGYSLPRDTRVTLSAAFGWMQQDDDFLPYSINPTLTALTQGGTPTVGTDRRALPRRSLDGEIFTTVVDFRATSQPLPKLDVGVGYHFDNRENKTPRDLYVYIHGDAEDQGAVMDGTYNLPYSFRQHRVDADVAYEIWRRTKLGFGYELSNTHRDYQEVDEMWENTFTTWLTSQPYSFLGGRLRYEHSWRNSDHYDGNEPFVKAHTSTLVSADFATCVGSGLYPTSDCPFENHPLLRKYYLADRDRDEVRVSLLAQPHEDVSVDVSMNWVTEDYDDTELGVTQIWTVSPGVDVSWAPTPRFSMHAFYNYMKNRTRQRGLAFSNIGQSVLPTREWRSTDTDRTHTTGLGFDVVAIPNRLDLGLDYLYADSKGKTSLETGSALGPVVPYPHTKSEQHNVSARAEIHVTENLSVRLGYLFSRWRVHDWAIDGITPTSLTCSANACVIASGRQSEDYFAHVASGSVVFTFW